MANPNTGRFSWHELMLKDASVIEFYKGLFGWTVDEMDMGPMGKYRILKAGSVGIAGAMDLQQPGVPSHWLTYVGTEDPEGVAKKVTEHGGKVIVPVTEVPNMVEFIVAMDPQGAVFGAVKGLSPNANDPPYDGPPRPGAFVWDELLTKDIGAAAKFYGAVFGWTGFEGDAPMKYWHWQNQGKEIGGMMTVPMPTMPSNWLAYIGISDVDGATKKVTDLGGKVLMPAMEIEKVGKFSVVADPGGAAFALFRSARV